LGVNLLDHSDHITYETIASDQRHITDEPDDIARMDRRGDRQRLTGAA
jgi:hypothetical protein